MRKCLLLAVLLAGCANMDRQDKVGIAVVSAIAAVALAASASKDDESAPAQCTTVIKPSPGGGIGTNVTFC